MMCESEEKIRLGMIGMTEGNGHPYSWSAIINGFDRDLLFDLCPFAVNMGYLHQEPSKNFGIPGVKVTHVYCDRDDDAVKVAKSSYIDKVVDRPEEMIGEVDAVIIATDVGSEHVERARPFVNAGIPIFIDKPLCDNKRDLEIFKTWVERDGRKILSSSSLRYSKEFMPYRISTSELGDLRTVFMPMAKKWETYGIHALEAIFSILGPGFETVRNSGDRARNVVHITHQRGIDVIIACVSDVQYGGPMHLAGTRGHVTVRQRSTFHSFKTQLKVFVDFVRSGEAPYPFAETEELMKLLIAGIASRENGGELITL